MKNSLLRPFLAAMAAAVLVSLSSGCAGYRLGSMLPPEIRSVYVPTFVNKTKEPLLEVETTRAVIEALQEDGSLKVLNEGEADAALLVTLSAFDLSPLRYDRDRRTLATEYRMRITAKVALVRRLTNEVLAENPRVQGESTFPLVGDLTSAKRRELPRAADDLAHDIVEQVVESWR